LILFTKLKWKNFLSTGNSFTEIDLNSQKTTLIVGENGAGKSTMLDALSFVLFNKPFRKVNKPQLLNSINKKDLVVEILFRIGSNQYKIIRGMKPTIFEIHQNGVLLNQNAESKDYQEVLEKQILKINHKSFCQVVILGSASFVPFMQLPAAHRREIIEDLLDLQIFTTMNSLLKDKIADTSTKLVKVESDKRLYQERVRLTKEHLETIRRSNENTINEKKTSIDQVMQKMADSEDLLSHNMEAIKKLKEEFESYEAFSKRGEKLYQLELQLSKKLEQIQKSVDFFNTHDNCPTCKQDINHAFKHDTIDQRNSQIEEVNTGLQKLSAERVKWKEKNKHYDNIRDLMYNHNMKISSLNNQIKMYNDNVRQLEKEIEKLAEQHQQVDTKKIEELEELLVKVEGDFNLLQEDKITFNVASTILKDGGIKSKIIKQYIPIINKFINKYLSSMDFFVNFELNEEFQEKIKSRFRDEFTYSSFSEGEKMRINLAILFTWRAVSRLRNSINTNILIMDEVFDSSLDTNGTEEFMKILSNITTDTNTFIISHKTDQLYDKFEQVIKFEKHKNFSRVAS
jgi:DNA repair exonuclease SbcCD ATPase subunit